MPPPPGYGKRPVKPPPRKGRKLRVFLFVLGLVVLAVILLQQFLFQLRRFQVIGNSHRSPAEILSYAGLSLGDNILYLNKDRVIEGINADRYLIFKDMVRDYPDGLIIRVEERVPCAYVRYMGVQYTLDREGMVLEHSEVLAEDRSLVAVSGLDIKECRRGVVFSSKTTARYQAYLDVMSELWLQGAIGEIVACDFLTSGDVQLVAANGMTIRLGDTTDVRAKIGAAKGVLLWLSEMGYEGGNIDVSRPIYPTYRPVT